MKSTLNRLCCLATLMGLALLIGNIAGCGQNASSVQINVGGITAESDVVCGYIILDDSWEIRAGTVTGFRETPPSPRVLTLLTPTKPMPATYSLYWGIPNTRVTFRVEASAPEFVKKAEELVRRHSAENFRKMLIITLLDSGEVQVWLDAKALPHYDQGFTELLGSFQGVAIPIDKDQSNGGRQ